MAEIVHFRETEHRRQVVIIVDGEPAILAVLTEILNDFGLTPLAAQSAEHARDLIRSGITVDLVFSDARMPGNFDDFNLARWISQHHPEIPVILTSRDLGKANPATELYGVEIIPKPYDFEAAARKIQETIKLHCQRRS